MAWKYVQYENGKYRTTDQGGGASTLSDLSDTNIEEPSNGQILTYNSTSQKWENNDSSGGSSTLSDLNDVDITNPISMYDLLAYNGLSQKWININFPTFSIEYASDVNINNIQNGQMLVYNSNSNKWVNITAPTTLAGLSDVNVSSPTNNYVLSYNSSAQKWIPMPVLLSLNVVDVGISSPTNGQVLTYNSTSQKWENVNPSGGSGMVDDVQVNDISVVTNKVAKIKSYKEITQAQYNALPSSKTSDGIMYCIIDAPNATEGFPPLIYSDEEREVGVWRDGKPIYQKTFYFSTPLNISPNMWTETDISSVEIDKIINADIVNSSNAYFGYIGAYAEHSSYNEVLVLQTRNTSIDAVYMTLRYTKINDIPGSGIWNTQGTYNVHYSTTEHIIGTWIDGKPLYEKTIFLQPTYSGNMAFISVDSTIIIHNIIGGVTDSNGGEIIPFGYTNISPTEYVRIYNASATLTLCNDFVSSRPYLLATIQYTKTTD